MKKSKKPTEYYILGPEGPVRETRFATWMDWMTANEKDLVLVETKMKDISIVTSFVGVPAATLQLSEPPKLFQTQVFGGKPNGMIRSYAAPGPARKGHHEVVALVRKYFSDPEKNAKEKA